jgi:hypothetical protein
MTMKDALFFFGAAFVAVIIAKLLVYNISTAQQWF